MEFTGLTRKSNYPNRVLKTQTQSLIPSWTGIQGTQQYLSSAGLTGQGLRLANDNTTIYYCH